MIRTFSQTMVEEFAQYADVPLINGLTDYSHPCQALADVFTALEKFGNLEGRKLVFIGDGNNVANSLMFACAKLGMDMTLSCPAGYQPDEKIIQKVKEAAKGTKSQIEIEVEPFKAVIGADIIYTDVWTSMGQEKEAEQRKKDLQKYKVDQALVSKANKDVIIMHCLPAHRGEEIDDDVMEGCHSAIFDEAENRLHVQKAIMALLMSDKEI
jgi:ornithine carbamoyltransferase